MGVGQTRGRITFFRVNEAGSGYGPPEDRLDAEVIVAVEQDPRVYGLALKNDDKLPAAQAMFELLEDAFEGEAPVTIEFWEEAGRNNHRIVRVIRIA